MLLSVLYWSFLFPWFGECKGRGPEKKVEWHFWEVEMHHELKWFFKKGKVNALTIMHWSCYVSWSYFWPSIQNAPGKEWSHLLLPSYTRAYFFSNNI